MPIPKDVQHWVLPNGYYLMGIYLMFLPDGCKLGNKSLNPILQDLIGSIGVIV